MQQRLLLTAAIATCASLLNACDAGRPTAPISVSEAVAGGDERLVAMMDACDPESFEAVNVTCVRSGGVTFQHFLKLLRKHQTVGAWHFSPGMLNARVGQTLLAVNRGGRGAHVYRSRGVRWRYHRGSEHVIRPWMRLELHARP